MAWQYLQMAPAEVMKLTPREFHFLMEAEKERRYDAYETEARISVMHRVSNNKEKLTSTDIYQRPKDSVITELRGEVFEEEIQAVEQAQDFLARLKFE